MKYLKQTIVAVVAISSVGSGVGAAQKERVLAPESAPVALPIRRGAEPVVSGVQTPVESAGSRTTVAAPDGPAFEFQWFASGQGSGEVDLGNLAIGRKVVVLYGHLFGLYPRIWRGIPFHGSIPQRADLAAHVQKLKVDIQKAIPDPNWDGYAVIDYESWWPAWEQRQDEGVREESLNHARAGNPRLSSVEIEKIAAAQFEEAAGRYLLLTLETCKAERPRAKWGYYSYPSHFPTRDLDVYKPILDASTALFPSIYVRYYGVVDAQRLGEGQRKISAYSEFMERVVREAGEVAGDRPVLPFIWVRYSDSNHVYGLRFLNDLDLRTMLGVPWRAGADGAIFWDDISDTTQARRTTKYFKSRVAPEFNMLMREMAKGPPTRVNERTFVKNLRRAARDLSSAVGGPEQ